MEGFFCIILFIFISIGNGINQINKNNKRVEENKKQARLKGIPYYFDYNSKTRLLSNDALIYIKTNNEGDICYYDNKTHQLIYNESEVKRKQSKINTIKNARINNLKYFSMPYVYKKSNEKGKNQYLSEIVETKTLQPFQLRYVPVSGYGFVMRKAPAIDPNRLYNYEYKYDESKWGEWHVISKEKYVEMSGKPIYEYEKLYYYDLNKIIKNNEGELK